MDTQNISAPSAREIAVPSLAHATDRYNGPTTVYRMFDADDRLLYVGVTCNTEQRWARHRESSAWWPLVARKTLTVFPNRRAALDAESAAIQSEAPEHNVTGNPRAKRRDVHLVLMGERAERLAGLARAKHLSISHFVGTLIDAALAAATDSDPDMDEALRRVREDRPAVTR